MVNSMVNGLLEETRVPRQLEKHWNGRLIAGSIAISLLGAFTSTQLMCQARTSRHFSGVLVWATLASLTFGFCSIWSLHYIATLACELDLPMGINVPLTILSAILAVAFTFAALAFDLLSNRYNGAGRAGHTTGRRQRTHSAPTNYYLSSTVRDRDAADPLLDDVREEDGEDNEGRLDLELGPPPPSGLSNRLSTNAGENAVLNMESPLDLHSRAEIDLGIDPAQPKLSLSVDNKSLTETRIKVLQHPSALNTELSEDTNSESRITERLQQTSSEWSFPYQASTVVSSSSTKPALGNISSTRTYRHSSFSARSVFDVIYLGSTRRNMVKGLLWSLAITGMHYVGLLALHIPSGYLNFNPVLMALSGVISWIVCLSGCILMPQMEVHLLQQFLFAVVATSGVAAMHFTGTQPLYPSLGHTNACA